MNDRPIRRKSCFICALARNRAGRELSGGCEVSGNPCDGLVLIAVEEELKGKRCLFGLLLRGCDADQIDGSDWLGV